MGLLPTSHRDRPGLGCSSLAGVGIKQLRSASMTAQSMLCPPRAPRLSSILICRLCSVYPDLAGSREKRSLPHPRVVLYFIRSQGQGQDIDTWHRVSNECPISPNAMVGGGVVCRTRFSKGRGACSKSSYPALAARKQVLITTNRRKRQPTRRTAAIQDPFQRGIARAGSLAVLGLALLHHI